MDLPHDKKELDIIFNKAKMPLVSELEGEYDVNLLTGLPSLRRFNHRKLFYKRKNKVFGYNLLFANKKWGYFFWKTGLITGNLL